MLGFRNREVATVKASPCGRTQAMVARNAAGHRKREHKQRR